jgi:uncharacterized membrane protein
MDNQEVAATPVAQPAPAPVTPPSTAAGKNVLMAVLAYIGILVLIPYLVAKDDPFVKYHIKQGLVLLAIEVAVWIVGMALWQVGSVFGMLLSIINLGTLVLSIVGIVNAVQGKEKELPLVGQYASKFNI